ncbi:MAG: pyridoxal-dependent decarboxylase [Candidatus Cloacimonadota bacterium]|nr:MAG: pyridoxal-dependent decarboxylase [Candidatus Cloacimonadota bacterium]
MQQKQMNRLSELLLKYNHNQENEPLAKHLQEDDLKKILEVEKIEGNQNWDETFDWIEKYLSHSPNTANLDFSNRMWSKATLPSILAEIVTATNHSDASTYESAPVATIMEKYMIGEMLRLVGYLDGEGQMTTGSSNANMLAMMCARNLFLEGVKASGLYGQKKLKAFVNEDAHYSLDKAMNILGLGLDNLIKIPSDKDGRMDIALLEKSIQETIENGDIVFFVTATSGTTVRGAFDSIKQILNLRDKYNFWLHVDGAWGGPAFLSKSLRLKFLDHLEDTDSFTFDFHKMPGIALICNMLLINKRRGIFKSTCSAGTTNYIFHGGTKEVLPKNLGEFSLQCGRRIDSLKLFLDWKFFGAKGISDKIENYLELAKYAEKIILDSSNLELVVKRESFNLCFRFITPDTIDSNEFNQNLRNNLLNKSIFMVGTGVVDKQLIIRYVITNPDTTKKDIDLFFKKFECEGLKMLQKLL